MNVATEENIIRFDRTLDPTSEFAGDFPGAVAPGMVYAAQRSNDGVLEHDSRGLVVAILLCMACWGALGFFLLS
jgi:hypothetical protein